MKVVKFRPHLCKQILDGSKKVTWRLFDDKDLSRGDEVEFWNKETFEPFAKVVLIEVRMKQLGDVNDNDFEEGHERYESHEQMIETFRKYYGDKVTDETEVKIIKFELK